MPLILRPPDATHSLTQRLEIQARAQRFWTGTAGVLHVTAVGAAGLATLLLLDGMLSLPAAVRALGLAGWLVAMIVALVRSGAKPLSQPASVSSLVLAAEARHPHLNDALASAVAFARDEVQDAFRQAAIRKAEALSEPLDWSHLLPMPKVWRGFWFTVLGLMGIVFAVSDARGVTGLLRAMDPWNPHPWPTRTRIELQPYRELIAVGDEWSVRFALYGVVPESATLAVRHGVEAHEVSVPLQDTATGDATPDPSRVPVSFEFQVRAGDAATSWHAVRVSPPPRLVPFDGHASPMLHLEYPGYTAWKPLDLASGTVSIEAVCGTRVTCMAATDRPIAQATLSLQGSDPALAICQALSPLATPFTFAAAFTAEVPVTVVGPERTRLSVSFTPPWPGVYALRFIDDDGLTGTRLLEMRLFPDPAPQAALIKPEAHDVLDLLPTAALAVDARGDDRTFAVRTLALEYRQEGETWQSRKLASHPLAMSPSLAARRSLPLSEFVHADHRPTAAGDVITLRVTADDFDDRTLAKEPGRSREVQVRVHSPQSLEALLQKQLTGLRAPLQQALDAQTAAMKTPDTAANEAEVRRLVAETLRGAVDQAKAIVKANALPASKTTARLKALDANLKRLDETLLHAVESARAAQGNVPEAQQAVQRELRAANAELSRWAGVAELQSDAHALAEQLRKAGENGRALRDRLPAGVAPSALPASDRAALEAAAADHAAAAEAMTALRAKAEAMRDAKATDPKAIEDVDKLEKAIRVSGGAERDALAKAAEDVRANRLANAEGQRAQAEAAAKAMEAALSGRDDAPEELRRKKKQSAAEVQRLRNDADELAKKADAKPDEREELRRRSEALAEQLAGQGEDQAAETLRRASEALEKNDPAEADQQLAKAQEQLQKEVPPKALAREPADDVLKALKAFRDRQHAAIDEATRLSAEAVKASRWTRPLAASLVNLAERERSLAKELREWSPSTLAEAPVFARLVSDAVEAMERARERIRERKDDALVKPFDPVGEAASDAAMLKPMQIALRRLDHIVGSLDEKAKPNAEAGKPAAGQPMPETGGKPKLPPVAQLKALRDWQRDVRDRTAEFANAHPDAAKYMDDERAELATLQQAQADIAKLFEALRESLLPMENEP